MPHHRIVDEDTPPILDDEDLRPSTEISPARNKRINVRTSNPQMHGDMSGNNNIKINDDEV